MFDTATLTISGNVVADPRVSGHATDPERVTFRVVSNRRRRDPETGEWKQVGEYGMNVVCWRKLARGVAQALRKGDPVLVQGRVSERKYVDESQQPHWMTELTAEFVGHDLSQGTAGRFTRFTHVDSVQARAESATAGGDGFDAAGSGFDGAGGSDEPNDESQFGSDDFAPTQDFDDVTVDAFDSAEPVAAGF
ncbi:MAG: single-stranded DNA-binding protein [Nakamurella sp.]